MCVCVCVCDVEVLLEGTDSLSKDRDINHNTSDNEFQTGTVSLAKRVKPRGVPGMTHKMRAVSESYTSTKDTANIF